MVNEEEIDVYTLLQATNHFISYESNRLSSGGSADDINQLNRAKAVKKQLLKFLHQWESLKAAAAAVDPKSYVIIPSAAGEPVSKLGLKNIFPADML